MLLNKCMLLNYKNNVNSLCIDLGDILKSRLFKQQNRHTSDCKRYIWHTQIIVIWETK